MPVPAVPFAAPAISAGIQIPVAAPPTHAHPAPTSTFTPGVLIMESLEHAQKRGANIICEYLGGAWTGSPWGALFVPQTCNLFVPQIWNGCPAPALHRMGLCTQVERGA